MSLVGTRPILQEELRQYELHHRARIAIKPGITGMWQVSGRSDITDFEEVVRLDTEYISNWNFGLDGYAHILMGPGKKSKIYKFAEKVLGNKALTLTCCESEDEEAKKFSRRTAYVETGVNLADLSASLDGIEPVKNDKFTVFTLGRACVQKQPQLFNKIAELVPEAQFIWIGNGELENELTAPNIEVTGWKPRKEALAMAKGADAFILCSLGEAIAMSLIENMYIKKLILVSNTMGNKSVINDGVNGYVCNTAEEYAERIKVAMKDFPSKLPERAYQDVLEIYNTDVMKKKYIAFYNDVINRKYER